MATNTLVDLNKLAGESPSFKNRPVRVTKTVTTVVGARENRLVRVTEVKRSTPAAAKKIIQKESHLGRLDCHTSI